MPSESFTTSLRSVNSPTFIKKYDKRANCLLSRSCHHCHVDAIIGPRPIYTRKCARICASVWVLALARRGRVLHTRVNVQATRVTSSLLALVYQVSCDLYCTSGSPNQQKTIRPTDEVHVIVSNYDENAVKTVSKCLAHKKACWGPEFEHSVEEIMDYQWDKAILSVRFLWRARTRGISLFSLPYGR